MPPRPPRQAVDEGQLQQVGDGLDQAGQADAGPAAGRAVDTAAIGTGAFTWAGT
jgi:hypothetical protein